MGTAHSPFPVWTDSIMAASQIEHPSSVDAVLGKAHYFPSTVSLLVQLHNIISDYSLEEE